MKQSSLKQTRSAMRPEGNNNSHTGQSGQCWRRSSRNQHGHVLAEYSAASIMIIMVCVPLILTLLAAIVIGTYRIKVAGIATTVASSAARDRYWLGVTRPGYNKQKTAHDATDLCAQLMKFSGLNCTPHIKVDVSSSNDYCKVDVEADSLPLVKGGRFANFVNLKETTCKPYIKRSPIGWYGLTLNVPTASPTGGGMYFPSYGAAYGTSGPSSIPDGTTPYWLASGYLTGAPGTIAGPSMAGPYEDADSGPRFYTY